MEESKIEEIYQAVNDSQKEGDKFDVRSQCNDPISDIIVNAVEEFRDDDVEPHEAVNSIDYAIDALTRARNAIISFDE